MPGSLVNKVVNQFFRLLDALMKVHPIPRVIFETTRSGFIQILHHLSVSWKITPLYFLAQTSNTLDKNNPRREIFRLLSGWVRIQQIFHVIFETSILFYFKLCITFQCHERELFCTFLYGTLYDFYKRIPSKCKISEKFWLLRWNFTKFILDKLLFWKYIKFQLKKCRRVMSHDTEDWCKIFKKNWFVSKMTRIWGILICIKSLQKFGFLLVPFVESI